MAISSLGSIGMGYYQAVQGFEDGKKAAGVFFLTLSTIGALSWVRQYGGDIKGAFAKLGGNKGGSYSADYKYWKDSVEFDGNKVYQRDDLFDSNTMSSWKEKGKTITGTNIERMASGRAPIGYDGKPINLHHVTQKQTGSIAEVSQTFHQKHYSAIHSNTGQLTSEINRTQFDSWRRNYWINRSLDFK